MWSRAVQVRLRQPAWRATRRVHRTRHRNGPADGPHTTYFQPPYPSTQPRRFWRSFWWSSTCFTLGAVTFGAVAYFWIVPQLELELEELSGQNDEALEDAVGEETAHMALLAGARDYAARRAPPIPLEVADSALKDGSTVFLGENVIGYESQLPSNMPCEDTCASASFGTEDLPGSFWSVMTLCDGHAGAKTAHDLKEVLPFQVCGALLAADCMHRPYTPNDRVISDAIRKAFLNVDQVIIDQGGDIVATSNGPNTNSIAATAAAFSGSCALMSIYDPNESVLRVANVGDSRAVLGRWDNESQTYVAKPMSIDQTGFNPEEVSRIEREHPGEAVVDPKTGRLHGLAVTRAFGDARWKWTEAITQRAHELLWGPRPRPNGVIKTPPYLTAEPDVMETRIHTGANPDFLIMASDGLWDIMSSQDAVECVQMWLSKYKPTHFIDNPPEDSRPQGPVMLGMPSFSKADDDGDADTYYDANERCLKWRVSAKHYVVEDAHCGVHLIKNALGGSRRNLFTSIMSVQPPWSREMRDDITVQVLFFGVGPEKELKAKYERGMIQGLPV